MAKRKKDSEGKKESPGKSKTRNQTHLLCFSFPVSMSGNENYFPNNFIKLKACVLPHLFLKSPLFCQTFQTYLWQLSWHLFTLSSKVVPSPGDQPRADGHSKEPHGDCSLPQVTGERLCCQGKDPIPVIIDNGRYQDPFLLKPARFSSKLKKKVEYWSIFVAADALTQPSSQKKGRNTTNVSYGS